MDSQVHLLGGDQGEAFVEVKTTSGGRTRFRVVRGARAVGLEHAGARPHGA